MERRPGIRLGANPGPAIIAHQQGNRPELAKAAIEAGADYLEVDLWLHRGRFEARHERRFPWRLPVLFEKWYLRFAPRRPMDLIRLMSEMDGAVGLFLDLKNVGASVGQRVADAVTANSGVRIAASAQRWATLRGLSSDAPGIDLYYSVDVLPQLDLFLSLSARDRRPRGVSCRHSLLTRAVVERLHERGLEVVAWTVDDPGRAEELSRWGVDGITTNRVRDIVARLRA